MEYNSPLRYPGGKSLLANFLQNVILYNNLEGCQLYEPFAGGAGASLKLLKDGIVSKLILNDADISIYSFWKSILSDTERFVKKIKETPVNIKEWKIQKRIYSSEKSNLLSLGFATFYLNRCNRSGIIPTGGPIGGKQQNGNWKIDARFNKDELISRILNIVAYSNKITFTNNDAKVILKDITKKKDIFIYIDPPYYKKGRELYLNSFSNADHLALSKTIKKLNNQNWLLTYDNCDFIINLYTKETIKILSFYLNYSLQDKKKGNELLICPIHLDLPSQIKLNNNIQKFQKVFV